MNDLETLRPEVQEAMHRLENYLHITIDGKHFRSEDYDTIRAELLRLAAIEADALIALDCEHDWQVEHERAEKAKAELGEAQNTIAAQQDTMGALKRKLALAEGELAALKARILPGAAKVEIADTDGPDGNPYGWVGGTLLSHNLIGKRVRLVVEK